MSDFFHFSYSTHIGAFKDNLQVGSVLMTGDCFNHYFLNVLNYQSSVSVLQVKLPVLAVLNSPLAENFTKANIIKEFSGTVESLFKVIREFEFERIRVAEFPELPSRMRCLWMTDKSMVNHWRQRLHDRKNMKLFRVSAKGKIHRANEGFLPVEVTPINELQELARAYWRGEDHKTGKFELLLEGVLSRNRRKFRQPINVACPAPGRWGRPNSRVTSRHFDHGNASRTSRPDCSGLDEAD